MGSMLEALVTGGAAGTDAVAAALRGRGFRVCVRTCSGPIPPLPAVDCYVQMPWVHKPGAAHWSPECLVARLDVLAMVACHLGPRATVLLAVEESDLGRSGPSDDLLGALALVVLEDRGRADARVVVLPAAQLGGSLDEHVAPPAETGVNVVGASA